MFRIFLKIKFPATRQIHYFNTISYNCFMTGKNTRASLWVIGFLLVLALIITPVVADTMTREDGVNRDGNDFASLFPGNAGYNGTPESCSENCLNQPACNAATFVPRDQSCWLKTIVPSATSQISMISFLRVKSTPSSPGSVAPASPDNTGGIAVGSTPVGANVYLDGEFKGLTPLNMKDIPAGTHNLLVTLKGYDDQQQAVTVTAGTVKPVTVDFGGKKTPGFEGILAVLGCLCILMIGKARQ